MNSRFKFRVWDKYTHETPAEEMQFLCFNGCLVDSDGCHHSTDDYIVEQCTGLSDKNGKLIYEGDVVKCDRDFSENGRKNLIRKVIFADGSFQLERAKTIGDRYYINAFHNFEIIGNVHTRSEE